VIGPAGIRSISTAIRIDASIASSGHTVPLGSGSTLEASAYLTVTRWPAGSKTHRGEGVGKRLLTALIEDATSLGMPGLSLSVHLLNPVALHIYEQAGFVRVGGTDTLRVMFLTLPAGGLPRQP
jgi:GNAT superfamily N-acetyltransferase